ncbi:MAG: ERF family protein [Lachnospiraceae bacterium]|nr:ERF family protein [Lachnospiraceae bacterium]
MNIYEKLLYIQQNLKAPKGQYSEFGNYKYRSYEDIQEALKPLLNECRAVLLLTDDIKLIGDRFYVMATAILQDVESNERITNTAYARETDSRPKMEAAQITGSCSSYARKYALNGLFCIDDTKGADASGSKQVKQQNGAAGKKEPGTEQKAAGKKGSETQQKAEGEKPINSKQAAAIRKEIKRTGAKEEAVCYQYKIKSLSEMNQVQYNDAMDIFHSMKDGIQDNAAAAG